MTERRENQQIAALVYGVTVLPASVASAGFFPFEFPLILWPGIALVGAVLAGSLFWEGHRIAGAIAFGVAGLLSPIAVIAYVESSMRNAMPWQQSVEFSASGLFVLPVGLLVVACVGMLVWIGLKGLVFRARAVS